MSDSWLSRQTPGINGPCAGAGGAAGGAAGAAATGAGAAGAAGAAAVWASTLGAARRKAAAKPQKVPLREVLFMEFLIECCRAVGCV
jgi:hypothetical protein